MLSYTSITRTLNKLDGTNLTAQVVKRRMQKLGIPKEVFDDPQSYNLAISMLRKDVDIWEMIGKLAQEVELNDPEFKGDLA